MITSLAIENFKCFERLALTLSKLTVVTGFNASGKSSAVQPLLLLAQANRTSRSPDALALNGPMVRLGTVGDVLRSGSLEPQIRFEVTDHLGSKQNWDLDARAGDRFLSRVNRRKNTSGAKGDRENEDDIKSVLSRLVYISAVREGTADAFGMPDPAIEVRGDVGFDGRFAAYWLEKLADEEAPSPRRCPSEPGTSIRKQLDGWLATLFREAQASVQALPQVSLLSLQFRTSSLGEWRRPANVGYGFSYAFPILVALLTVADGDLIVIDSPEAHLHPYAQSQMGRLLGHFANAGVQIVVETHSDHLLNGVRLAVKEQAIPNADVAIHFFTGATARNHGVVSPPIDSTGRISDWPVGFFDQAERDLTRLSDWA